MANKVLSKRKNEQSQPSDAKKLRLCSLHSGIIRPQVYKTRDPNEPDLVNYTSAKLSTWNKCGGKAHPWQKYVHAEVISWGTLETVKALIKDGLLRNKSSNWKHIPDEFKDAVIGDAILSNEWVYKHMNEERKRRKDLLLLAINYIGEGATHLTEYIPDVFKSDIDVVISLLEKYAADRPVLDLSILPSPYEWCDQDLFSQPVFVMQAIRHDYGIMDHLGHYHPEMYEKVSDNKQFVLQFIEIYKIQVDAERDGDNPLAYVSKRLCDDPDVLNKAAEADKADNSNGSLYWNTLNYASKRLCEDPEFVIGILQYLPGDVDDPDYVREMLENNCPFLACDIDFITSVVKKVSADAILWFDDWFRNNFDAVSKLSKANPLVLAHVSDDLRDNLYIIQTDYCKRPSDEVLEFASDRVYDFIESMKDLYAKHRELLVKHHKGLQKRQTDKRQTDTDDSINVYDVFDQINAKRHAFIKDKYNNARK